MSKDLFFKYSSEMRSAAENSNVSQLIDKLRICFPYISSNDNYFDKTIENIVLGVGGDITRYCLNQTDVSISKKLICPFNLLDRTVDSVVIVDETLDDFHDEIPFSLASCVNRVANWTVRKTASVAIVMAFKDEGPWLLEWIAYHRALGFTEIFIGFNDCSDLSNEMINVLTKAGIIYGFENRIKTGIASQLKFYNYCVQFLPKIHEFELVFFIDADEFIAPVDIESFKTDMIDMKRKKDASIVYFPWMLCSGNYKFAWEEGLVTNRFVHVTPTLVAKSAVDPKSIWSINHPHTATIFDDDLSINASGDYQKIDIVSGWVQPGERPIAYINHYFSKSFEEFVVKKTRGRGDTNYPSFRPYDTFGWEQRSDNVSHLSSAIKEKLGEEIAFLKSIETIKELEAQSVSLAKERIFEISKTVDLRDCFSKIEHGDR